MPILVRVRNVSSRMLDRRTDRESRGNPPWGSCVPPATEARVV